LPIKFFICKTGGLVRQLNEGLKRAKGELFLRTDDDAEYTPQTISEIVKTFEISPDIGGACGPTVTKDLNSRDLFLFQRVFKEGNFFWRLAGKFYYNFILEGRAEEIGKITKSGLPTLGANYKQALRLKRPIEVDQSEAITFCFRTVLLRKIGSFDESFGLLGEYHESDTSLKVRNLGYRIMLNPKAFAYHHTSRVGVFSARADSYDRMMNFINFYFRHIKPNTFSKALHFLASVLWQNAYFTYMFLKKPQLGFLGCYPASVVGVAKNIVRPESWRGGMK
jgi:GT2 family glycosyltransferase